MSLKSKLIGVCLMLGLVFTSSALVAAQQPATASQDNTQQQEGPRGGRHGMGKRGPGGVLRLISQLNLTDAQQEQLRAIAETFEASTKAQREEMRKLSEGTQGQPSADTEARRQTLRAEIGQAMRGRHEQVLNILTAEQRTQLEQLVKERKARHMERRGRRTGQPSSDDDN